MPHKIGFVVVSSSGHEDGFSARELMVHAPTVSGWRSPRFCQFPQEIVLQMVERCRIRKLQLLAHQHMIASKVEFYVSESLPEYLAPYQAERFRRLGYVSLCDNEKTGCRARELKSVYVDAVGQFLKLIFHQNHVNKYNIYNQVALVAINIIGDPVDFGDESNIPSREKLIDHYLGLGTEDPALEGTSMGKSDYISPLDDLAFDMYQDPEVAQLIRRLDERKRVAVREERYDYAKKLKQAIADLQKVGERLGRYEVEKRCAVEKEDYDLAKEKKQQMEQFRAQVYAQLQHHGLVDPELMRPHGPAGSPRHLPAGLEKPPALDMAPRRAPASRTPPTAQPGPSTQTESLPYDERPLPTTRQPQAAAERSDPDIGEAPGGPVGEPEPLTEKAWREAGSAIEVLGETLVAGAYSRTWSHREDALLALHRQLAGMPVGTPREELRGVLRAAIFLVSKAIRDVVTPVFQASLKLLKMMVTQFVPKHRLGRPEASHCVERTFPALLARTGDSSARLRLMASNLIQEMALCKEVRPLQMVPSYLLQPLKANVSPHLALSQMGLLARLLRDLGTGSEGFPADAVMKFTMSALEHRVYEVRETAVQIILDLYRQHRPVVLEHMPPQDANSRRNVLYRTIFEGFARIDGRPTDAERRAQRKAATEEAERRKKEEIQVLQGQLAALRELEAEVQDRGSDSARAQNQDSQGRKVDPPNAPETPDNHYLDKLCIFCGERNEAFTEEGLDLHYWKHCLMLTRCGHCQQVVEIASLTEHLLTECDRKDAFGKCQRCGEAVLKQELPAHIMAKECEREWAPTLHTGPAQPPHLPTLARCPALPPGSMTNCSQTTSAAEPEKLASRCPLCHENFTPGEEAWRAHLMGPGGCTRNLRRTHVAPRAPALPPGKGPVGVRAVTAGSKVGSKIPTPKGGLSKNPSRTYVKR